MSDLQIATKWGGPRSPTATEKAYIGNGGYQALTLFGTNQDIPRGNWGAAIAYQINIAAYRAVEVRAQAIAGLRWVIETRDGELVDSSDNDATTALGQAIQDCVMQTGVSLFELWEFSACVYGETYIELARNDGGYLRNLTWLNPVYMTVIPNGLRISGYRYSESGVSVQFKPDEILFARRFHPTNRFAGLSPMDVALDSITVDDNFKRFLRAHFRNDARPGGVLKPSGTARFTQNDMDNLAAMTQQTKGTDNAGRTAIIPFPADYVALDPVDLSKSLPAIEEMKYSIYTAFGVSPAIAGDSNTTRYQQSPQDRPNFYINTIYPEATKIASHVNTRLIPAFHRGAGYVFRFDTSGFSVVDEATLVSAEQSRADYQAGIITLNEARDKRGLGDIPQGDTRLVPVGMLEEPVPTDTPPQPTVAPSVPEPMFDDEQAPPFGEGAEGDIGYEAPVTQSKAHTADTPQKYRHIDFTLPNGVRVAAKRALQWIADGKAGSGFTDVGRRRASDLARADYIPSPDTVRRMRSYFSRHAPDTQATGFNAGEDGYPSAGRVAWDAWGGDAGQSYARDRVERMNAADKAESKAAQPDLWQELATFRKFALQNGGRKARRFEAQHINSTLLSNIKMRLAAAGDDKAIIKQVFADVEEQLMRESPDAVIDEDAIAQTLAVFAELAKQYPDMGFDEFLPDEDDGSDT